MNSISLEFNVDYSNLQLNPIYLITNTSVSAVAELLQFLICVVKEVVWSDQICGLCPLLISKGNLTIPQI